jgi:hypothetical protein
MVSEATLAGHGDAVNTTAGTTLALQARAVLQLLHRLLAVL